jgi:uncharacterized membrane protein YedE/YeeE
MTDVDIPALATRVLWAVFALAAVFGAIGQRTRFCTMGAVSDIVGLGDWTRMRMWVLAMAVAMLGFNAMVALGSVAAADTIYAVPTLRWLSALAGGLLFGIGMVLASGCGSRTLVRIGTGNLKSLVVFLVMGVAAFATLRGITAVARVATVDRVAVELAAGQDLPSLLAAATGMSRQALAAAVGGALGLAMLAWALAREEGRRADVLLGGLGSGAVVAAVWWVSGVLGHVAEHPDTLEEAWLATNSQRMESLTFVAPIAYTLDWLIFFSDKSKLLTLGVVSVAGVVVGSMAHALATREFRWEGFRDREDLANHLVGGALMGVGGVTAMGCTIGQGITGLSTLAVGSFIALGGIVGGAVLGLRWQIWRIERQAQAAEQAVAAARARATSSTTTTRAT